MFDELRDRMTEAFKAYCTAGRELHAAQWQWLSDNLPTITEKIVGQYPGARVEARDSDWTDNPEFYFQHWLEIEFRFPVDLKVERKLNQWLEANIPELADRGDYTVIIRGTPEPVAELCDNE